MQKSIHPEDGALSQGPCARGIPDQVADSVMRDVHFSSASSILSDLKGDEDRCQTEIHDLDEENDDFQFGRHFCGVLQLR